MFSAIKGVIYNFLGFEDHSRDIKENVQEILKEINLCDDDEEEAELTEDSVSDNINHGKSGFEFDTETVKFFHNTGRVTYIDNACGVLNGVYYFNMDQVSECLTLKLDDEVAYTAYSKKDDEAIHILKIYSLKEDSWEICQNFPKKLNKVSSDASTEMPTISRVIIGKITRKKERKLYIEPHDVWCNLDEVETTFVPMEGDWVALEAIVTIDEKAVDLSGKILEISSLRPVLIKHGTGRITFWDKDQQHGAIENKIYISQLFCSVGYIPTLGDEVSYLSIESDIGRYKLRALNVTPCEGKSDTKNLLLSQDIMMLRTNKNDIVIKPISIKVDVEYDGVKDFSFEIHYTGPTPSNLEKVKINGLCGNSQIKLKNGSLEKSLTVCSSRITKVNFEVCGKYLGGSEEMCVFYFGNCSIGKLIFINVTSNADMKNFLSCETKVFQRKLPSTNQIFLKSDDFSGTILFGPKPYRTKKFIKGEKAGFYRVPRKLFNAILTNDGTERTKKESIKQLKKCAPVLEKELDLINYADRFHTLLYLEEIEVKKYFQKLNQNGIILKRQGEYIAISVTGIGEQRPFPVVGDKAIVTQPWSKDNVRQVGYIHEIHQCEILVKFHESFHQNYDDSDCDVVFEPSLGNLRKAHDAVNRAVKKLGAKWLFPKKVDEKPSLLDFKVDLPEKTESHGETSCNDIKNLEREIDDNGYVIQPKIKLTWFNEYLNEMQKTAVVNALKARGRPLPYLIFGPPGTGKTFTLVELALQIYFLIPGSRILLSSPSNSACDLLCLRLISAGGFQPGQLVRVIAYHKVKRHSIPGRLIPYSTLVDISDDSKRCDSENLENLMNQLVGPQRIIAGTCSCVGSMHSLGFPEGHFTHILIDEAGQATEPDILIPATFQNVESAQVILAGDPQQLGPVCLSRFATQYGLGISLMQRLLDKFPYQRDLDSFSDNSGYDPRFLTKLKINYRSVPEILQLPNKMFYNNELISTVSPEKGIEGDIIKKFNFTVPGRKDPASIVFHSIVGQNCQDFDSPSWFNPHEVWQVVNYLKKLYDLGLNCRDVGVIAPYIKQCQKIRILLNELNIEVPKIGTVEDFQGQERLVILVTTVRSTLDKRSTDSVISLLGFLSSPRRLNVALTRARALLIIIGNPLYLFRDAYWKTVVDYCKSGKCWTGSNVLLLDDVETELKENINLKSKE